MFDGLEPRLEILTKQYRLMPASTNITAAVLLIFKRNLSLSDQGIFLPIELLYSTYINLLEDQKMRKMFASSALSQLEAFLLKMPSPVQAIQVNETVRVDLAEKLF